MSPVPYEEELEYLNSLDDITLINYIQCSFDAIAQSLAEDKVKLYKQRKENLPQEYESVLIKYEADIREHIKIEHQMKLYVDSLEAEKSDVQEELKKVKVKMKGLLKERNQHNYMHINKDNNTLDKEISLNTLRKNNEKLNDQLEGAYKKEKELMKQINDLKNLCKSYEEQTNNLTETTKKLRDRLNEKEKELKEQTEKLKTDIQNLKQKETFYEEKIKELLKVNNVISSYGTTDNKKYTKINNVQNNNYNNFCNNSQNIHNYNFNNNINNNYCLKSTSYIPSKKSLMKTEAEDMTLRLNRTQTIRKSKPTTLSATVSIDRIEKYLNQKYSTIKPKKRVTMVKVKLIERNNKGLSQHHSLLMPTEKNDDFFSRMFLLNETQNKKQKQFRDSSLENSIKTLKLQKAKQSQIIKDILNQSGLKVNKNFKKININKNLNSSASNMKMKNTKRKSSSIIRNSDNKNLFDLINNINNFAGTLNKGNHNIFARSSVCNSSSNNSGKQNITNASVISGKNNESFNRFSNCNNNNTNNINNANSFLVGNRSKKI